MIISRIIGGLGNQMFQYAAGRALSLERGVPQRLDISGFAGYMLHQGFELERIFNHTAGVASEADVRDILGWQHSSLIQRLLMHRRMALFRRKALVVEPHFQYWDGIKDVPRDCYLAGYWQSERYFSAAAAQIRADFAFRQPLAGLNAELTEHIGSVNAVSLHVRRGDYANNPTTTATHGLCSPDYFRASVQYIADRVPQPYFFVFSDDIAWVKANLKIDFPHQHVNHNQGAESYNDMRLMSLCKHHIIANSSFSWWGAWLNPDPGKIVVAPRNWFANANDVSDLLPQGWVTL